jgi:hypothetical protein
MALIASQRVPHWTLISSSPNYVLTNPPYTVTYDSSSGAISLSRLAFTYPACVSFQGDPPFNALATYGLTDRG